MSKTPALSIKGSLYVLLMSVLICVCSWITIPLLIPFTMQTFAVFCALLLLGGRKGTAAIALYLCMGTIGLPVFSGFRGGIGHLLGPTGGYLVGFLCSGVFFLLLEPFFLKRKGGRLILLCLAYIVCCLIGTLWFVSVYALQGTSVPFLQALSLCVLPFLIPDLLKTGLAVLLCERLRRCLPFGHISDK